MSRCSKQTEAFGSEPHPDCLVGSNSWPQNHHESKTLEILECVNWGEKMHPKSMG